MADAPELSRPVRLDRLGGGPQRVVLEASEAERAALARRFRLIEVLALTAHADLTREGEEVNCVGTLAATLVQACVASGEPVPATIAESFALRFLPPREAAAEEEIELDGDDLDTVEYLGGAVDVGEAVAQTLALALDPFPRASGAEQALRDAGVVGEEDVGPFAALKALKDRL